MGAMADRPLAGSLVLVVDDRASFRRGLCASLVRAGAAVVEAATAEQAWARFREEAPALVVTSIALPEAGGVAFVGRIRARTAVPVVALVPAAGVEHAVAAVRAGADEVLAADAHAPREIVRVVARWRAAGLAPDAERRLGDTLVGESPAAQRLRDRVAGLAGLDAPVLVSGEPGSGRDTVARLLHALPRRPGAFVRVGAGEAGELAELPAGGTLYLDGVERFAPESQRLVAKLLERDAGRSGARLVASAGPALRLALEEGTFHRALGEGLLRFEVALPPLRERPEDVPRIARSLLARVGRQLGRPGLWLRPEAETRLRAEPWPDNVAELARVMERLVAFATASAIGARDVEAVLGEVRLSVARLRERAAQEERDRLVEALHATRGNVTHTARRLGRSRAAVYRLVEKHGLPLRRGP